MDPNPEDLYVWIDPILVSSVVEDKDCLANRFTKIEMSTGGIFAVKEETAEVSRRINEARKETDQSAEESNDARAD